MITPTSGRFPDFVVIGAMKGGTTWLFRSLEAHPDVCVPPDKELEFFIDGKNWDRGQSWYQAQFRRCDGRLTGEATPAYLDPMYAADTAARLAELCPRARLVAVLREPLQRARSHYVHDVLKSREVPPPSQVYDPRHRYHRRSLYWAGLRHYYAHVGSERLLVVTMQDLFAGEGWRQVLDHLGLAQVPPVTERVNEAAGKLRMPPWVPLRAMTKAASVLPAGLRARGRRVLPQGPPPGIADQLRTAPLPELAREALLADLRNLAEAVPPLAGHVSTWRVTVQDHP